MKEKHFNNKTELVSALILVIVLAFMWGMGVANLYEKSNLFYMIATTFLPVIFVYLTLMFISFGLSILGNRRMKNLREGNEYFTQRDIYTHKVESMLNKICRFFLTSFYGVYGSFVIGMVVGSMGYAKIDGLGNSSLMQPFAIFSRDSILLNLPIILVFFTILFAGNFLIKPVLVELALDKEKTFTKLYQLSRLTGLEVNDVSSVNEEANTEGVTEGETEGSAESKSE